MSAYKFNVADAKDPAKRSRFTASGLADFYAAMTNDEKAKFRSANFADATLSWYIHQLELFDRTLWKPLASITWSRDIASKEIPMGAEATSFHSLRYGVSGVTATGLPYVQSNSTEIPAANVAGDKVTSPVHTLAAQLAIDVFEMERATLAGIPIEEAKTNAINMMYQMSQDQVAYVGDRVVNKVGAFNNSRVTSGNVATANGTTLWNTTKGADAILVDVQTAIQTVWESCGYKTPQRFRMFIPPEQFGFLSSVRVSTNAERSLLSWIRANTIANSVTGMDLDIQAVKWLSGARFQTFGGGNGSSRMVMMADFGDGSIRFPNCPIRRLTTHYQGIGFVTPYAWTLGQTEIVYPESMRYYDGI